MTNNNNEEKAVKDTLVMCYMRWSTKDQFDGDSERRQLTEAEEWCGNNGYSFDKNNVIQDSGKSGFYAENFSEKVLWVSSLMQLATKNTKKALFY